MFFKKKKKSDRRSFSVLNTVTGSRPEKICVTIHDLSSEPSINQAPAKSFRDRLNTVTQNANILHLK